MWVTNKATLARQEARREQELAGERIHRQRSRIDSREVAGRGLVLKVAAKCPTCGRAVAYFADDGDDRVWWTNPPRCDVCLFDEALQYDYPEVRPSASDFDREFGNFVAKWPMLGKALKPIVADFYARPRSDGRFEVGEVTLPSRPRLILSHVTLDEVLARHAAGDHGDLGRLDKFKPTDDQKWLPEVGDLLARNARAIDQGSGIVRSRFEVPADQLGRLSDAQVRAIGCDSNTVDRARIEIGTLLRPDAPPRTHVRLANRDAMCFQQSMPLSS